MLPFHKFVKMEIDQDTSNCHCDSSKPMQIYRICMQIQIRGNFFKIFISVQYNALKGHIFDCGIQFIQHNNKTICSFVNHDVTTKHNTQINAKIKTKKIKKKTFFEHRWFGNNLLWTTTKKQCIEWKEMKLINNEMHNVWSSN